MLFTNLFLIIKIVFLVLWVFYSGNYLYLHSNLILESIITLIIYYVFIQIIIWLFFQGEKIVNLHIVLDELEYEKQLKSSLFKITHEIKNPIAVCKGYLDMLDINKEEQVRKYIPIIKEEMEQTLVIIKDFLKIGHVVIEKDIMDVVMLIEDLVNSYEPILKKRNIECHIDMNYDELFIDADYNRLKQVLLNVIKNGTEAIEENGQIDIKLTTDKTNVYIEIKDNGCGMSNEDLKRLKKPFFTTKKNGIGLGVSLSDEIIKAHDGKMQYTSEKGQGTTVLIQLKKS
jgi:signal transduction histidine kinase